MAFDIDTTAKLVQTNLKALKDSSNRPLFFSVEIARPGQPVGEGPSATIHGESVRVVETTLTNPIELHTLHVVLWRAMNTSGEQARELEAMTLAGTVMDYIYGDFTLGAGVRAVDVGGIYGSGFEASFEPGNIEAAEYHVADITVPLIVDSSTAFVP